jgi:hypothetical protein
MVKTPSASYATRIISEVNPAFSRKPIFGYEAMVYALASLAFLSFIVWAHHMFTVAMRVAGQLFFTLALSLLGHTSECRESGPGRVALTREPDYGFKPRSAGSTWAPKASMNSN